MNELQSIHASGLMQRLAASAEPEVHGLRASLESVAAKAAHLLSTVVVDMPLYTLHNERHVLNVVAWMEALLGEEGMASVSPLECAISILAAYIHDLGMTLDSAERAALDSDADYLRFCDRYVEERHLIASLHAAGGHYRANLIENHLRSEFIRTTHADGLAHRMCTRLRAIAPELVYRGFDYRRHLELVAVSHNHPVEWLRFQCEREGLSWRETVGRGEPVNVARVGILLRLADIMDFDSTRTPSILFRHIGLENDLASRFDQISAQEWKKHLAITGIDWPAGGPLTYRAANCPHPAIEKCVREFVSLIRQEANQAASELRHLGDEERFPILLPEVRANVTPAREGDGLRYAYHDWHFRLDQEEIIRLLMGESLYGDPGLCIRELLQNALDAIELRDLRLQLRAKGGQAAEGVDGEWIAPGRFIYEGIQEAFEVNLTWGEEGGRQFIRVSDNGIGMTEAVIERYFTQIGKSLYRSPDFRGEQAEMRSRGLIATPISTFGIGVLSCFMIADRVTVRTHPGQVSQQRKALDLEISGPGSLFWTRQGTRTRQGTEVTLWLRTELHGKPVHLQHDPELCFARLRTAFGYDQREVRGETAGELDPGFIAAKHVVWPKYPVRVEPAAGRPWTIDDRFHAEQLASIDGSKLARKAVEWGYSRAAVTSPAWELLDWEDNVGENATGSRVRLWVPTTVRSSKVLQSWELATLVEPQVSRVVPCITVQGMAVEDVHKLYFTVPFFPGAGYRVWFDLRGAAAPALTADRGTALTPRDAAAWENALTGTWARYVDHVAHQGNDRLHTVLWNFWHGKLPEKLPASLGHNPKSARLPIASATVRLSIASMVLEATRSRARFNATLHYDDSSYRGYDFAGHRRKVARDPSLDEVLDLAPKRPRSRTRARAAKLGTSLATDPEFARDLAIDLARSLTRDPSPKTMMGIAWPLSAALDDARGKTTAHSEGHVRLLFHNWLQEAFFPELSQSWPGLGLEGLKGRVGDAALTAPAAFRFDLQEGQVLPADPEGREPVELATYHYDICFPMTAIPIGSLRRNCAEWREDRRYRAMGTLPLLLPQLAKTLKTYAEKMHELFSADHIYALWPAEKLWFKPFADWTQGDWASKEHRSLLWNIDEGVISLIQGVADYRAARGNGRVITEMPDI